MAYDREVAGIRCLEVLEILSDYLDGDLDLTLRAQVDGHLGGCSWCASFGGHIGELVLRVRAERDRVRLDEDAARRLAERLSAIE